jgi:hypothetical protein
MSLSRETRDSVIHQRLSVLEEQMQHQDHEIASLRIALFRHLHKEHVIPDSILERISVLEADVSALRPTPPDQTTHSKLNSVIISDFPEIFAEFRERQFWLLWRGSRDGFGAEDFHNRCDGHANTLTIIPHTDGNIFGGFTPMVAEALVHAERELLEKRSEFESLSFDIEKPVWLSREQICTAG